MSFALLLLATFGAAAVNADYLSYQSFTSSTCAGAPLYFTVRYIDGCGVDNSMFAKVVCTNASYGVRNFYLTDNTCSSTIITSTIIDELWGCTAPAGTRTTASSVSCISGDYTAPTSGLVSKTGYTETTCPVTSKPSMTSVYTTDLCISTTTTTSGKASCFNSTHSSISMYANTGCSGTANVTYTPIGCSINQYNSVVAESCVSSSTSGAASISVALLSLLSVVFAMATLM